MRDKKGLTKMAEHEDSILVLNDREKVQQRPGMYIGNNDKLGLATIAREIVDNAIDEYPNFPDKSKPIIATLHSDNSMTVRDYGRGISPYESHKNKGQIEERLAYTRIGAGGKMQANRKKNGNSKSAGLNGTGAAATNFMSEYYDVTIWKDGRIFHDRFEDGGIPVMELKNGKLPSEKQTGTLETGTEITFKPSDKYMRVTHFDANKLETLYQQMAYLHAGMRIQWKNERDGDEEYTEYCEPNGLYAYMDSLTKSEDGDVPLLVKPFTISGERKEEIFGEEIEMSAEIAIAFSKDNSYDAEPFTNGVYNKDGGTHMKGFYAGLMRLIKHYYKEFQSEFDSKYKKQMDLIRKVNDTKDVMSLLKSRDVSRFTYVIMNFTHSNPILAPQTKDKLESPEAKQAVADIVYEKGMLYLDKNIQAVHTLMGYLIKTLYEQAKEDDSNVKLDKRDAKLAVSTKLAAARNVGKGKGAELILVEGDSAAGSLKENRDADFQAILPLRGKVLNVQKTTLSKALGNKEISTIFAVLGAGFGKNYDESKLDYDKVIICTDADTDGSHIAVLLQTLFMTYMPELMMNGHVYRLQTPLFVNTMRAKGKQKAEDVYTYNNEEQEEFMAKNKNKVAEVNRNKGLGELTKDQVVETILTPESRHLDQIVVKDEEDADDIIDELMGNNVQGRKKLFIEGEEESEDE